MGKSRRSYTTSYCRNCKKSFRTLVSFEGEIFCPYCKKIKSIVKYPLRNQPISISELKKQNNVSN